MGLFVDDLQVVVTNDKGHLLDDELVRKQYKIK